MLISESYREQNKKLHETRPDYGTSSSRWIKTVKELSERVRSTDILDYGCGKSLLKTGLGQTYDVSEYDPAITGKDSKPEPHDIVICTDVMEHIEPELLDDVLDDLKRVTKKALFLTIATRPAKKFLEDGRNAHLIQEGMDWWYPKIEKRFNVLGVMEAPGNEIVMLLGKIK